MLVSGSSSSEATFWKHFRSIEGIDYLPDNAHLDLPAPLIDQLLATVPLVIDREDGRFDRAGIGRTRVARSGR